MVRLFLFAFFSEQGKMDEDSDEDILDELFSI